MNKKKYFGLSIFILLSIASSYYAVEFGITRHYFFALFALIVSVAVYTGVNVYNQICNETEPSKRSAFVAKQKLLAEVAAAFALGFFIVIFFHIGSEIDRGNIDARSKSYSEAEKVLKDALKGSYCASNPDRKIECDIIFSELDKVWWVLIDRNEAEIHHAIIGLQDDVRSIIPKQTPEDRARLEDVISLLDQVELINGWADMLYGLLPLLLFLSSASVISRKVAVAAYDASTRRKPIKLLPWR